MPDPARDPGAYKTGRILWSGLEEIDHAFTRRPGIVARYHEYEDRLFEFQQTQRAALDALIVRDAPAAEFEPVYLRYTPAAMPRMPYKQGSPGSRPDVIADYHDLVPRPDMLAMLNRNPRLPRPGAPLGSFEELQAYGDWLAFRKAEERGEAAGIRAAREKVIKSRGRLQGKSYAFIGARLGLDPKPASVAPAAPDAAAQPLDALLAQLRALVAKDEKHAPAGRQVIAAWEKLRRPEASGEPRTAICCSSAGFASGREATVPSNKYPGSLVSVSVPRTSSGPPVSCNVPTAGVSAAADSGNSS